MYNKQQIFSKTLVLVALFWAFSVTQSSYAESPTKEVLREQRQEINQERKEIRGTANGLIEQAKNAIKEKIKKQIKGKLITIVGSILTVQKDQTTYTVTTTDKTELKRRFGASSSLSEFTPNDELLIIGNRKKNTDGTLSSTEIEASYIRNMSIQRRFAVFTGEVTSISGDIITIQTKGRGIQTVSVTANTQYKEKNTTITLADITIGNKLVVKGELWNRVNNKIDAKTILKLNIQKPSVTPSVTKTPETE